jgi:hypothetical protein
MVMSGLRSTVLPAQRTVWHRVAAFLSFLGVWLARWADAISWMWSPFADQYQPDVVAVVLKRP